MGYALTGHVHGNVVDIPADKHGVCAVDDLDRSNGVDTPVDRYEAHEIFDVAKVPLDVRQKFAISNPLTIAHCHSRSCNSSFSFSTCARARIAHEEDKENVAAVDIEEHVGVWGAFGCLKPMSPDISP